MTFPRVVSDVRDEIKEIEDAIAELERRRDDLAWRVVAGKLFDIPEQLSLPEMTMRWMRIDREIEGPRLKLAFLRAEARASHRPPRETPA